MASKAELQTTLKEKFGINKNVSQSLSQKDCEELLDILQQEPSTVKLVESYSTKNSTLGRNNASYSRAHKQAERRLEILQAEYRQLEQSIASIETAKKNLELKKGNLEAEQRELETKVELLVSRNQSLGATVQTLTTQNDELSVANTKLKKENKDLKNIVDQIRLRLARDTKELLQYEDSEIRKAVIRLFRWTLN